MTIPPVLAHAVGLRSDPHMFSFRANGQTTPLVCSQNAPRVAPS